MEFEEKVDIDDLVLPSESEPMKLAEIEINNIKQEPVEEKEKNASFESDHDEGKKFKLKMEESILKLYDELDKEKYEDSMTDISLRKSLKVRQFVENITKYDSLERYPEVKPFSCKFCDESFQQVHEVKEHIKIHVSISEVEDLRNQLKSLKTQVEELEVKLKDSQSKLAFQTKQKEKSKRKAKIESELDILETDTENVQELDYNAGKKCYNCSICEKDFSQKSFWL